MARKFTPYEINQLNKFGMQAINPDDVGERPVEYITNHCEFYHRDYYVNSNVLIPRLDSEKIVEIAKDYAIKNFDSNQELHLADIACGSGCLGISLFLALHQTFNHLKLTLSDISQDALNVAKINCQKLLPSSSNYTIIKSDLFNAVSQSPKIDILISNPPYIPTSRIGTLDESVRKYEPLLALDGGEKGNQIINRLLKALPSYVSQNALIVVEIDHEHNANSFETPNGFTSEIITDDQGHDRFLQLKRLSN